MKALIAEARKNYYKSLLENGVLTVDTKGIPSNADSSSKLSIAIARRDYQFFTLLYLPNGLCEVIEHKTAEQKHSV